MEITDIDLGKPFIVEPGEAVSLTHLVEVTTKDGRIVPVKGRILYQVPEGEGLQPLEFTVHRRSRHPTASIEIQVKSALEETPDA